MYWENLEGQFTFQILYSNMANKFNNAKFVEIGVWKGKSAVFMAEKIKESRKNIQFWAIDTFVKPRWTKGFASWSILAYGMNRKAMEKYIQLADNQPRIADSITYYMMTNGGMNFYVASPPLVVPSKSLSSNIRGEQKNYEQIRTVYMMGINDNDYE